MQQQINKINFRLLFLLFFIYEIVYFIILKSNTQTDEINLLSHALIFAFFYIIYMIILAKNEDKVLSRLNKPCFLYIGISLSFVCIFATEFFNTYHLWMIGCLLISVAYGAYTGIVSTIIIIFMDGLCNSYVPEEYIFYEVLGIILCLLFEFMPDKKDVVKNILSYFYFVIISLSCNISLYLITNKLNYELLFTEDFYAITFYTIVMITVIYIISIIFIIKENTDEVAAGADYDSMLKSDYELLNRLKNELPLVFKHSLVVADISKKAAKLVGADETLTMVGGIYHEIGRLTDKTNYIQKNLEFAAEYEFDDKLTNIIVSHNAKTDKPKSKEAAIVYFTENILNTIYYMKNVRKDTVHTNKQIIESFFNKNIKDERLYESGFSIAEYSELREFYINIFEKQEG